MVSMIEVEGLTKLFGPIKAVDGVTFTVDRGEVLGFLGPNGAGKSTTMKMITGFLSVQNGRVRVCGHDVTGGSLAAKANIGYLPEGAPAYPDMTPITFLNFIADIRGLEGSYREERLSYVINNVHLDEVLDQSIDTLSKGFKRRVGLAQAILHDPPVLILDEPTDGLDPNQKYEVRTLIKEMATDKAIIISTHILEEVEAICTRAMIISRGQIVADGTPLQLQEVSERHNAVLLTTTANNVEKSLVDGIAEVSRVETLGNGEYRIYPNKGVSIIAAVSAYITARAWDIETLTLEGSRLDEVFRKITGSSGVQENDGGEM